MLKPAIATGLKIASRRPGRSKKRREEEEELLRRKSRSTGRGVSRKRAPASRSTSRGVSRRKAPAFSKGVSRGSGKARY